MEIVTRSTIHNYWNTISYQNKIISKENQDFQFQNFVFVISHMWSHVWYVKCEVRITFQVNSCGTNELEKYKKRVSKIIFNRGTLWIDQNQSPALPQHWMANKRAGCPAGSPLAYSLKISNNLFCSLISVSHVMHNIHTVIIKYYVDV